MTKPFQFYTKYVTLASTLTVTNRCKKTLLSLGMSHGEEGGVCQSKMLIINICVVIGHPMKEPSGSK